MKKDFSCLSSRQKQAYKLRQRGLTYQKIAETMQITKSGARSLVISAGRRLREQENYLEQSKKNNEPVAFPVTRGELKLIEEGLYRLAREISKKHNTSNVKTNRLDNLPYEAQLIDSLIQRAEQAAQIPVTIDISLSLKQKLKILRENHDLTQNQVASYLNVERSTYAYYEIGKTKPSIQNLLKLAELYTVSLDFLVGIEGPGDSWKQRRVMSVIKMETE